MLMKLNAPKKLTWQIAIILGLLGLIGYLAATVFTTVIPVLTPYAFWLAFAGFGLLGLGCFVKGL